MREDVSRAVAAMIPPDHAARAAAAAAGGDAAAHARAMDDWPCMSEIELRQPDAPPPPPETLTVAAWNIERCKRVEESAALIRRAGADVVLATEMDWGMARSGQRHATRDLAALLGMGYAYGVEFVELGTGDPYETRLFEGQPNDAGLHGNAILSRFPLKDAALLPLDAGGMWFVSAPKKDGQHRVGGRMAMAARIETAQGALTVAAAHYESESDAAGRARQTETLLAKLAARYGAGPAVIGGDVNTNGFREAGIAAPDAFADPAATEPMFDALAQAGFDWRAANCGELTTRPHPAAPPDRTQTVLDWLFTRGVAANGPFILPALCENGRYLSDHELIGARIAPGET